MIQDKQPQNTRINRIDLTNLDPELSQFKYHFKIIRVCFQETQFQFFLSSVHNCFEGMKLESGAICFVQISQSYGKDFHDVMIGFKRDREAYTVYLNCKSFVFQGQQSAIQLSQPFQYMLEERGALVSPSDQNITLTKSDKEKGTTKKNVNTIQQVKRVSRSRSREKERELKKKQGWAGRLWGIFAPKDWTVGSLTTLLTDNLHCAKNQIHIESQVVEEIPIFIINFRSQSFLNSLMAGTRATQGMILLIKDQEIKEQGLLQAIRQRQIRAVRVSTTKSENPFYELCRSLVSFKEFNLIVVTVTVFEDSYLVIVQNRVMKILKFLRISGWKFQTVNQCIKLPVSSTEKWQKFLLNYKNY